MAFLGGGAWCVVVLRERLICAATTPTPMLLA
jgi:hypothetical protein